MGGTPGSNAAETGSGGYCEFSLLNNNVSGVGQYTVSMTFPASFPAGTTWNWSFPHEYNSGVYGYPNLIIGIGAPNFYNAPTTTVTPKFPNSFTDLTLTYTATFNTTCDATDIDWLIETWASNVPNPVYTGQQTNSQNEIGFYAYVSSSLMSYVVGLPFNFSATIGGLNVYVATRPSSGTSGTSSYVPPFTIMVPVTTPGGTTPLNMIDGNVHTINFGLLLQALVSNGVISNSNYIVGYDFGPEVYQCGGSASVSSFAWTWN